MFVILRKKIKKFFSFLSNPENREKGLIPLLIVVALLIGAGVALYSLAPAAAQKWLGNVGMGVLKAICLFLYSASCSLANLASTILSAVLSSQFIRLPITRETVVKEGWKFVRDLANMLIVLGFVAVGIATALRIREYEAQKKLLPLILIAILINFSTLICGIIIDSANITMDYFLTRGGGGGGLVVPIMDALQKDTKLQLDKLMLDESRFTDMIGTAVGMTFFNIIAMVTFAALALILLVRQAALMALVIISPLAFFCWIFNITKKLWSVWWENFLKWCFIGVGTIFFVYLAAYIIQHGLFALPAAGGGGGAAQQTSAGLLNFLVPLVFLWIGLKLATKSSAMGATAVLGLAGAAAGLVGGRVLKETGGTLKGAYKAAKESRVGQKLGDWKTGALERMGLAAPGALAQREQKRGEEATKRMKAQYAKNPDRVLRYAEGRGWGPKRAENREAAAIVAAQEGRLDLGNSRMVANYQSAVARGLDIGDAEKKDPRLFQYNDRKINEIMRTTGLARADAVREGQRRVIGRQSAGELGTNLTPDALKDLNTLEDIGLDRHLRHPKFQENLSPAKIAALKQFTTAGTPQFNAISKRIADLKATGRPEDAAKADDLVNKQIEIDRLT